MSRFRTDLRPASRTPRSSKPSYSVRVDRSNDLDTSDMVRGITLHTAPQKDEQIPDKSPEYKEMNKELMKEIEKLKQKIASLMKTIEQLRAENRTKEGRIAELEEKLKKVENESEARLQKLKKLEKSEELLAERDKEIDALKKKIKEKEEHILKLQDEYAKEKQTLQDGFTATVDTLKTEHQKELTDRDEKIATLKARMGDILKDNSWERQHQIDELVKELKKVSEETEALKARLRSTKSSNKDCENCSHMKQVTDRQKLDIIEREKAIVDLQKLSSKMEKQLVQQDDILKQYAKALGRPL